MTSAFLPHLPIDRILAAYLKSDGNEIASGKIDSPASSAALVANTFGFFIDDRAHELPPIPGTGNVDWPSRHVWLEQNVRFPWAGGRHPWLDVLIETDRWLVGIESKRYEPFRSAKAASFSDIFSSFAWSEGMRPYCRLRERLVSGTIRYRLLDAAQLVKHAYALHARATKESKRAMLIYLYAEPHSYPDGRAIPRDMHERHGAEAADFAKAVEGSDVAISVCTYRALLDTIERSANPAVSEHARAVRAMASV